MISCKPHRARYGGGVRRGVPGVILCLLAVALAHGAPDDWAVPEATVRFTVWLTSKPTHRSAGYFVELPDGGILPRPFPGVQAVAGGERLKTCVLWQNPESGVGVVFEGPSQGNEVRLYVAPAPQLTLWTPASGLTPSAILCTLPGRGTKADAIGLSQLGRVPWTVHYRNRPGTGRAPLSLPGELLGRGGPCALYMLAYVQPSDAGRTWIAPITFGGGNEVRIDGTVVTPARKNDKAGGTGQMVDLASGLHRVELFGWDSKAASNKGLMTLTWRTPKTSVKELGGKRPDDLPYPGTPMWEARPLKQGEIVRSGSGRITAAESREGAPPACIQFDAVENFWMGDERPLFVYRLTALNRGHPSEARYEWRFGENAALARPEAFWLFPGGQEHRVSLAVSVGDRESVCRVPFYPFTTAKTDLNRDTCRRNFRHAAWHVLEAYPAGADPTANWDASYWNNFFRVMELGKGQPLLMHVFRSRWDVIEPKLTPEQRQTLIEIFLDLVPRIDPDMAIQWTRTFQDRTDDPREADMMQVHRAEVMLFYKRDPEAARDTLLPLLRRRGLDDASEWARIRYGDIEFLDGNMNEAVILYGDVQNRAGAGRPDGGAAAGAGEREGDAGRRDRRGRSFALDRNVPVADWKRNAVLDAAASETVSSLIEQGFLLEAKRALRDWERRFPLSKVSSDFMIIEAQLYMALEDWTRAAAGLEAYCDQVDASSFMPGAVEALLTCKLEMNEPVDELIAFCEAMKKKLEFHPVGQKLESMRRQFERQKR